MTSLNGVAVANARAPATALLGFEVIGKGGVAPCEFHNTLSDIIVAIDIGAMSPDDQIVGAVSVENSGGRLCLRGMCRSSRERRWWMSVDPRRAASPYRTNVIPSIGAGAG